MMPRPCRPRIHAARRTRQEASPYGADGWSSSLLAWGGGPYRTDSGRVVDEHTALSIGAVWACVRCIGESIAVLPWRAFRFKPGGDREVTWWDARDTMLHRQPNPHMTPMSFVTVMLQHVLLWGNAYAEIERSFGGAPLALWPLDPSRMKVGVMPSGEPIYEYQQSNGDRTVLRSSDVFHILGPSHDGIVGLSVVQYMRETLGLAEAMESDGARFFGGGSMPDLVLTTAARLSPEVAKQTLADWNARHSRSTGKGERTGILHGGLDVKTLTMPHDDSQWLEGRQFAVTEIARWFRVPPHKIGDLSRATFSNIEHQSLEFVTDSLMPWAEKLEQEADRKLFSEDEQRTWFTKFSFQAMLRGDMASRAAWYTTMRNIAGLNSNEIRAFEDMNAIEGGEKYTMQSGFTTLDRIGEDPVATATPGTPVETDEDDDERVMAALRPVLRDTLARCERRWSKIAEREKTPEALAEHATGQVAYMRESLAPFESAFMESVGGGRDALAIVTERVATRYATATAGDDVLGAVLGWYRLAALMGEH